jgi:hypothetical protein
MGQQVGRFGSGITPCLLDCFDEIIFMTHALRREEVLIPRGSQNHRVNASSFFSYTSSQKRKTLVRIM